MSEEGTRMARVLDSLGQVAAWYTVGMVVCGASSDTLSRSR